MRADLVAGHLLHRGLLQQPDSVELAIVQQELREAEEIGGGGTQPARARQEGRVGVLLSARARFDEPAHRIGSVLRGQSRSFLVAHAEKGVAQAQRLEDARAELLRQRATRDPLDDGAEDVVRRTAAAVVEAAPRLETEGRGGNSLGKPIGRAGLVRTVDGAAERRDARRVREEVTNGDAAFGADGLPRERGHVPAKSGKPPIDRIAQAELPDLDEHQHGRGRDRLREGGEADDRVHRHRESASDRAARFEEGDATAFRHEADRAAGDLRGGHRSQHRGERVPARAVVDRLRGRGRRKQRDRARHVPHGARP